MRYSNSSFILGSKILKITEFNLTITSISFKISFLDHADFFNLCPQRCNPKCQKPACHDILPQCQAFKSVCDTDEMIQWGCPVTCGKCKTETETTTKPECGDLYEACSGWANNCEHKSIATACPATCKVFSLQFDSVRPNLTSD